MIERRNLAGADALHFTVETEKKEYLEAGLPMRKAIIIPNSLGDSAVGADDNEEKIDFRKKNKSYDNYLRKRYSNLKNFLDSNKNVP